MFGALNLVSAAKFIRQRQGPSKRSRVTPLTPPLKTVTAGRGGGDAARAAAKHLSARIAAAALTRDRKGGRGGKWLPKKETREEVARKMARKGLLLLLFSCADVPVKHLLK